MLRRPSLTSSTYPIGYTSAIGFHAEGANAEGVAMLAALAPLRARVMPES